MLRGLNQSPWQHWLAQAYNHLHLSRLNRPADLLLIWLVILQASWLASNGKPGAATTLALLIAAACLRCAAWAYTDLVENQLLPVAPESLVAKGQIRAKQALIHILVLTGAAGILTLLAGVAAFSLALVVLAVAAAYPYIRQRTFLTQAYLGFGLAWAVPIVYAAYDKLGDKTGWLLTVAVLLWGSATFTLLAMHWRGFEVKLNIRSLPQLLGRHSATMVAALQLTALMAMWLVGRQAKLDIFFSLGWLVALCLVAFQQYLLRARQQTVGAVSAYHNNIWFAIALLAGIAGHYLCACTEKTI